MRALIQRVSSAQLHIDQKTHAAINAGYVVLVGFEEQDGSVDLDWMANKILKLRLFGDSEDVMNLSVEDVKADLMIVSQFTLHALTKKGTRPSYIRAAKPVQAVPLYEQFIETVKGLYSGNVCSGVFGANMQIELTNDGPVTIWLDSKNKAY